MKTKITDEDIIISHRQIQGMDFISARFNWEVQTRLTDVEKDDKFHVEQIEKELRHKVKKRIYGSVKDTAVKMHRCIDKHLTGFGASPWHDALRTEMREILREIYPE